MILLRHQTHCTHALMQPQEFLRNDSGSSRLFVALATEVALILTTAKAIRQTRTEYTAIVPKRLKTDTEGSIRAIL